MTVLSRLSLLVYNQFLHQYVDETIRKSLVNHPSEQLFFDAVKFVVYNQIPGDYLEFGVFEGNGFVQIYNQLHRNWKEYKHYEQSTGHEVDNDFLARKRFIAFDSFEGLPGSDDDNTPAHFKYKGAYAAPMDHFISSIEKRGVDTSKVILVPGWFDSSLTQDVKKKHAINQASLIFIDCDLYESTVPVLNFIIDLIQDGTVMIIDDYFRYKGHPDRGIQRAVKEWLGRNPSLGINEITRCSANRIAFICYWKEKNN